MPKNTPTLTPPAAESPSAAPSPADLIAADLRTPDEWAKAKGTEDWLLAAARARRLSTPGHPQRASWLENGRLSEAAFDETLNETLNGELR